MLSLRSFRRHVSDFSSLVSAHFLLMQSFSFTAFHVGKAYLRFLYRACVSRSLTCFVVRFVT
jgi:hypothetical protein